MVKIVLFQIELERRKRGEQVVASLNDYDFLKGNKREKIRSMFEKKTREEKKERKESN